MQHAICVLEAVAQYPGGTGQIGAPALDIQEQGDASLVRASLSGVRPEDVRIEAHGKRVTISGQVRKEQETERENCLLRERRIGQFYRTLTLQKMGQKAPDLGVGG